MRHLRTPTDEEPQRHRDHGVSPKHFFRRRLCFVLCGLRASVVREAALRQTNPIWPAGAGKPKIQMLPWRWRRCHRRAKQSQFPAFLGWKRGSARKQSQSARPRRPRLGIGDCRLGIRGRWARYLCGQCAKQTQFTSFGYIWGDFPSRQEAREIRDSRFEIRVHRVDRMSNKPNSQNENRV
jgi:hypothetical protein